MNPTTRRPLCAAIAFAVAFAVAAGCDRRTEPFVPDEKPRQPDLTKIFPAGMERAQAEPVLPPVPGAGPRGAPPIASASESSDEPVRGTVSLAPGFADRVPAGAVLFLIARAGDAGPPLAVERVLEPRFPLEFSLGPEDRMMEQMPFRGPLRISARLDSDGNATTREPTDLQGFAPGAYQPGATGVEVVIAEAGAGATDGGSPPAAPAAPAAATASAGSGGAITGTVTLAPQLEAPSGAVLFLIARTSDAGPPLAVKRVPSPSFPFAFSIGPDDRMIPSIPFAGAIRLQARLDADGNAMSRTPGDLFGDAVESHAPGDSGVELVVDQAVGG